MGKKAFRNALRHIPGPWHSLITHYPLKLAVLSGNRYSYIHRLQLEYGVIVRIGPNEISIADVGAFKIIHRAGLTGFEKNGWYHSHTTATVLGLFHMGDSKEHAIRKRMLAPGFAKSNLVAELGIFCVRTNAVPLTPNACGCPKTLGQSRCSEMAYFLRGGRQLCGHVRGELRDA